MANNVSLNINALPKSNFNLDSYSDSKNSAPPSVQDRAPFSMRQASVTAQLLHQRQNSYSAKNAPPFDPTPTQHQTDVLNQLFQDEFSKGPIQDCHIFYGPQDAKKWTLLELPKIQQKLGRQLTDDEVKQLGNDIMYAFSTNVENHQDAGTPYKSNDEILQEVENKWTNPPSDKFPVSTEQKQIIQEGLALFGPAGHRQTVGDHSTALVQEMVEDLVTKLQGEIGRPLTNDELKKLVTDTGRAVRSDDIPDASSSKGLQGIENDMLKKYASQLGAS